MAFAAFLLRLLPSRGRSALLAEAGAGRALSAGASAAATPLLSVSCFSSWVSSMTVVMGGHGRGAERSGRASGRAEVPDLLPEASLGRI